MLGLFKKTPEPSLDQWKVSMVQSQGLLLRTRDNLERTIKSKQYPVKVGIALPVKSNIDLDALKNRVEDEVTRLIEEAKHGLVVAIITGLNEPRFIEVLSYTTTQMDFTGLHSQLKAAFPTEDVQMHAQNDAGWESYRQLRGQ